MSGHSKWSSIKHKKAAVDARRGKVFSRHSKEIMVAARVGGKDPSMNIRLRSAVAAARAANMPVDNIERAIKKGAGELDGGILEELSYEGYAPGGVAVIVDCLSDNRNRTAAEIRNIFKSGNGNLAESGAVSRFFEFRSRFIIEGSELDEDKLMELCFAADVDVEDIEAEDGQFVLTASREAFDQIVTMLEAAELTTAESGITRISQSEVPVEDVGIARQVLRLLDALEDFEDVRAVYGNAEISDGALEELSAELG